jgi:hypothetical protein
MSGGSSTAELAVETTGGHRLAIMAAVRGLVSEGDRVRRAVEEFAPEAVAVAVGREDLVGLESHDGTDYPPANWEEEMYVAGLSEWGEVRKPPPCFLEAVRAAKARGLLIRALDFNDEDYTEAYVTYVGTVDLLFHTRLEKKARTHRFTAATPEAFVVEFDTFVNDPEGYVLLERARERHIARRIAKLAAKHGSLLAIVDYERATGVRAQLATLRAAP